MLSEDEKTGSLIVFLQCFLRGFLLLAEGFPKAAKGGRQAPNFSALVFSPCIVFAQLWEKQPRRAAVSTQLFSLSEYLV